MVVAVSALLVAAGTLVFTSMSHAVLAITSAGGGGSEGPSTEGGGCGFQRTSPFQLRDVSCAGGGGGGRTSSTTGGSGSGGEFLCSECTIN